MYDMKTIFWTIPQNTPIHSQGTNIVIEKSITVKHAHGQYDLYVMYFENEAKDERYWLSEPITFENANAFATMYRDVINSSIEIMKMCNQFK